MKGKPLKSFGYLCVSALLILSCARTELSQKYDDVTFKGKISNVLVIALTGSPHHQRIFEKEFVARLKSIGVHAVASEEVMPMPSDLELTKEKILEAVKQYGNDGVIITGMIGYQDKDVFNRLGSPDLHYYDYYRAGYRYLHGTGHFSSSTTVLLATNLYDVKTEKLIWSGESKTFNRDPKEGEIIKDVVKALVDNLQKRQLISPMQQ